MRRVDLNALDAGAAARELLRCCGSSRWARKMTEARPFASIDAIVEAADAAWNSLDRSDWLEAFAAHPKIGQRSGGADDAKPARWSAEEQAGVADAAGDTRLRLADYNREYQARFGYIFIVCATGKTAGDMLDLLERRLRNDPDEEIRVAAEEHQKITRLRLAKLLDHDEETTR